MIYVNQNLSLGLGTDTGTSTSGAGKVEQSIQSRTERYKSKVAIRLRFFGFAPVVPLVRKCEVLRYDEGLKPPRLQTRAKAFFVAWYASVLSDGPTGSWMAYDSR